MTEVAIKINEYSKDEVLIDANFDIDGNPTGTEIELEAASLLCEEIDLFIKNINIEDAKEFIKDICKNIGKDEQIN
jgi:hypothetical protein